MRFIFLIIIFGLVGCGCQTPYECALTDAASAKPDEIKPLVCLIPSDPNVSWHNGHVLLATWHNVPQVYRAGRTFVSDRPAIWTVSAKELQDKLNAWADEGNKFQTLCQLLGRSDRDEVYTHVSFLLVLPKDVIRPAYQTDVFTDNMTVKLDETCSGAYQKWFDDTRRSNQKRYPWTRLGYTCNWLSGVCDYGLSEFVIKQGARIHVEKTMTNEAFFNAR